MPSFRALVLAWVGFANVAVGATMPAAPFSAVDAKALGSLVDAAYSQDSPGAAVIVVSHEVASSQLPGDKPGCCAYAAKAEDKARMKNQAPERNAVGRMDDSPVVR